MPPWPTIVLAIAPGLLWLGIFHRKDDHEPEPLGALLGSFLLGAASVGLVLVARPILESVVHPGSATVDADGWHAALDAFAVTALLEETAKLLAILVSAIVWRRVDEPLDCVIYAIAVGLGFASAENIVFAATGATDAVLLQRGLTTSLGHVAFTGSLGYFLGHAWTTRGVRRWAWGTTGLASAIALHGAYDWFLIAPGEMGTIALLGVLPLSLLLLGGKIRAHRRRSPAFHP